MEEFLSNMFRSVSLYDIILYIVAGFVFIGVFRFVTEADRISISAQSFLVDLIVGFILKNICLVVPFRTSLHALNIVIFICVCILGGYLFGLLYQSALFNSCLTKLRIRSTPSLSIWTTITKHEESLWVRIGYKNLDLKYFGILQYCEEMQRYPQIALYGYTKGMYTQDLVDDFLEDYTGDMTKFVLLDTSKADYIEFVSTNEIRENKKEQ